MEELHIQISWLHQLAKSPFYFQDDRLFYHFLHFGHFPLPLAREGLGCREGAALPLSSNC